MLSKHLLVVNTLFANLQCLSLASKIVAQVCNQFCEANGEGISKANFCVGVSMQYKASNHHPKDL